MSARPKTTENIDYYDLLSRKHKRLTVEEEMHLSDIIQGLVEDPEISKEQAVEKLSCSNLRLVIKIAHDYKWCGLPFDDLVSEGTVGLMTAVSRFLRSANCKFSVYAAYWIKQAMRSALNTTMRTVRLPVTQAQRLVLVDKATRKWQEENDGEPTIDDLAELTGLDKGKIQYLKSCATTELSMDETMTNEEGGTSFHESSQVCSETVLTSIADGMTKQDRLRRHTRIGRVQKAIDKMRDDIALAYRMTYGIQSKKRIPDVICTELGISRRRLRELLEEGAVLLQAHLSGDSLEFAQ
jgi:RNA polymerase primary sigma factor